MEIDVIPAQAGIFNRRRVVKVPACAGMMRPAKFPPAPVRRIGMTHFYLQAAQAFYAAGFPVKYWNIRPCRPIIGCHE
jgi:hypothetical protein